MYYVMLYTQFNFKMVLFLIILHRICVLWNVCAKKCDQKMSKGTKCAMFYRPGWIGEIRNGNESDCYGKTICISKSVITNIHIVF